MDNKVRAILELDADISKAKSSIGQLSQAFSGIGGQKGSGIVGILEQIDKEIDKLSSKSGTALSKVGDFSAAEKSTTRISQLLKKLESEMASMSTASGKDLEKFFPASVVANIKKATEALKTYEASIKKADSKTGAIGKATSEYDKQARTVEKLADKIKELETKKSSGKGVDQTEYDTQAKQVAELTKEYTKLVAEAEKAKKARDDYAATGGKGGGALKNPGKSEPYKNLDKGYQQALERARAFGVQVESAKKTLSEMYVSGTLEKDLESARASLEQAKTKAQELKDNLNNVRADEANKALEEAKKKLEGLTGVDLSKITSLEDLQKILEKVSQSGIEGFRKALSNAKGGIEELVGANESMKGSIDSSRNSIEMQNRALEDVNGLKHRIQYFFSLTNGAMLARRAIREAFEAVKELDAAMTETAVVTNFSVGDMWDELPRYTEAANELGATTLGAYQTMTLFYQQGLDTTEAFELGTETMKMARIAGLEYAEATDLMTAALRGFNMELNQTSATRINDVYSELAAITAADTQEIATAMTKTASIANNANMEFETTAALLSQIIETTREPAETAGTAMKTIIARFTEMKKSSSEIFEFEGETVSVNKVETALKSAGVALRDTGGQFRDLDDVFLDLAQRWDSLDLMTQRYIATTAAGSRQQSRFIAMMSNYERTMELVDAAYDSSGASAVQFAKTQESVEAKLNTLKNAWDEFLMGIANNDFIKMGITLLTNFLNVLNDLTAGAGGFSSSLLKIFTTIAMFKLAKGIFNQSMGYIGQTFLNGGQQAGNQFNTGLQNTFGKIKTNFPFFGTLKKELRETGKQIEQFSVKGKINLKGLTSLLQGKSSEAKGAILDGVAPKLKESLMGQLEKVGTLTPAGKQWASELVDGYVSELSKKGADVKALTKKFKEDIKSGAVKETTTEVKTKSGETKEVKVRTVNSEYFSDPKMKGNKAYKGKYLNGVGVNSKDLQAITQQTQDWTMALMGAGMALNAIGGQLESMGGTVGKFGQGLSVVGNAASTTGMALMAATAIAKAFGYTLTQGPLIAIAAIAAAISLVTSLISKHKENIQKAREESIKQAKEIQEETKANRDLCDALEDTIQGYKDGTKTRGEVADAADELIEKYNLEAERVNLLTGDYERLTQAILEKRAAEEGENIKSQESGIDSIKGDLEAQGISKIMSLDAGAAAWDEVSDITALKKSGDSKLEELRLNSLISIGTNGKLNFTKNISEFTEQELSNLSIFLKSYLTELGNQLRAEDKKIEDSEIYTQLSTIINDTSGSFENLKNVTDALAGSIVELSGIQFEQTYDPSDVNSKQEYDTYRAEYLRILKENDPSLTAEEAEELADQYFNQNSATNPYVSAQKYVLELQNNFNSNDLAGLEIYQKYLNGEISPEEFLSLIISVDIKNVTGIDDINNQIAKNRYQVAANSPQDFLTASEGISSYINENFTLEEIDEQTLADFTAYLKVLNGTMPEGIDLLEDWNKALKGGTLGVSQFFVEMQGALNNRWLQLKEAEYNASVFGLAGTDEQIKADYQAVQEGKMSEEELMERYGKNKADFENAYNLAYNSSVEEKIKELEDNLAFEELSLLTNTDYLSLQAEERVLDMPAFSTLTKDDGTTYTVANGGSIAYHEKIYKDLENSAPKKADYINSGMMLGADGVYRNYTTFDEKGYQKDQKQHEAEVEAARKDLENTQARRKAIPTEKKELEKDRDLAKKALDDFKNKDGIDEIVKVNVAVQNAQQLGVLRQQLEQIKVLTEDGPLVDVSTFEQLKQITPEIAHGVKVLDDGTIDVSAGLEQINTKLREQLGLKQESTAQDIRDAMTKEQLLQIKLQGIIDEIDAELNAEANAGKDKITLQSDISSKMVDLHEDENFQTAQLYDEQADQMSNSAAEGAQNVVDSVVAMEDAYIGLGKTLDDVNEKVKWFGTWRYGKVKGELVSNIKNKVVNAPTNNNEPTEEDFTFEDIDPEKYKKGLEISREELEKSRDYYQDILDQSFVRSGQYATLLSQMLGGGTKAGDGSGDDNLWMDESEKENSLERQKTLQEEINDLERRNGQLQKLKIRLYPLEIANLTKKLKLEKDLYKEKKRELAAAEDELLAAQGLAKEYSDYYELKEKGRDSMGRPIYEFQYTEKYMQAGEEEQKKADEGGLDLVKEKSDQYQTSRNAVEEAGVNMQNTVFEMIGIFEDMKAKAEEVVQKIAQAVQIVVEAWTNREDILYNHLNRIERELAEFTRLQRYSTQLEKGRLASSEDIAKNWDAQWESLQDQLEMQEFRLEQRENQLNQSKLNPFSLISGWDPTTDSLYENREVKFVWDLMIGFGSAFAPMGMGSFFDSLNQLYEDYDSRVQEAYEDRLEAEEAILQIEDERLELVKIGSDEATEFEERILEALIAKEQEQIDELTRLNDSITDANSRLISTLQTNLDKIRQDRQNEKTEEDLSEKERRLAYLRQATGTGNKLTIKNLEEELEDQHESYTDQLIDQRIADLEKQNELAAEQRQKQIDLLQAQLDWSEKYGIYWDQIYGMLYTINPDGTVTMNLDNFDLEGNLRADSELGKMMATFGGTIGNSIWRQVLENEDLMKLGRYYQAFVGRNGVTGEWNKYWALTNPGEDDPASATLDPWANRDVGMLLELLVKIEKAIGSYFAMSDQGLINSAGRIGQTITNTLGKIFGREDWINYEYEFSGAENTKTPLSDFIYGLTQNNKNSSNSLSGLNTDNNSAFESGIGKYLGLGTRSNSTTSTPSVVDRSQNSVTYDGGIHITIDGAQEPSGIVNELEKFFINLTSTEPTIL